MYLYSLPVLGIEIFTSREDVCLSSCDVYHSNCDLVIYCQLLPYMDISFVLYHCTSQVSECSFAHDQWLRYALLLAWLLKAIKGHPHRKRYLASLPFLAIQEWISSLLLDEDNFNTTIVWPVCKALLECAASCDSSVMSSVIAMSTQLIPQHVVNSHAFNVITEIANTSLHAVLKEIKLPLPETLQQEVSQFYHVIQQIIHKACKKQFTALLSSSSLISLYVTVTPVVPE